MRHGPQATPRATVARSSAPGDLRLNALPARRSLIASVRDDIAFLKGFLQHPDQVGSVVPSSSFLEQRLSRAAGLAQARCVVELGPGTGGTTRAFLDAMRIDAHLLAIELSAGFHARLTAAIDDPRLIAQLGSAEQIAEFLAARRLPAPDAVLSGIPFSTMPAEVADRIAQAVAQVLAPGGRFVAYQVRGHVAEYATPYLGVPRQQWELLNIPPVRVFTWTKAGRAA
jgi:phosphatidylethanolamine/phosphatidyl-N-methylethanolamine N-methyltransferase